MKNVRIRSYEGPYFPAFGLNTERYSVSLLIQSECGKIQTGITRNTDTFYAVYMIRYMIWYIKWIYNTHWNIYEKILVFLVQQCFKQEHYFSNEDSFYNNDCQDEKNLSFFMSFVFVLRLIREIHLFRKYKKFYRKWYFLSPITLIEKKTPIGTRTRAYQEARNISFSETFARVVSVWTIMEIHRQ